MTAPNVPGYLGTTAPTPARRSRAGLVVAILVVLAIVAVVIVLVTRSGGSGSSSVDARSDCGTKIGEDGDVAFVAYVESNVAKKGKNSVLLIPYRAGDLTPGEISQCPTGGAGSTDLSDSGVLDANNQVAVDAARHLLFAVNQGSDTIAVFDIGKNGALRAVKGSPFDSGGMAPASLGLSGDTLVVANKAQDGVRDLSNVAPNYTTFSINGDGSLTRIDGSNIQAKPGSSPTDAYVPPSGGVVFSTEESGPIRAMKIDDDGKLSEGPHSPQDPAEEAFTEGFDPAKKFALGIVAHPSQSILYVSYPTVPALAVYSFDSDAELTYQTGTFNAGAYLPCWNVITPDGRWLYTANADTDNVTAYDLSDPTSPRQIQTFTFSTPGNPWNAAIDPSGKYLVVNTPRDTLKVPEGEGNTQHVLKIGNDGTLTEVEGSPVDLPVPDGVQPQGLAIVSPG